jgi:glycosyltransferase involved in cell wall biosynthesis
MENSLVSVITVTYNSAAYVRDTIESVLAQTYTNIEYIIVDDLSSDDTWSIIQGYKDPRIKAYRNEVNLREYPNRNKAIDLATGKYLIFIDGDDIIFTHGVEFFVKMMEAFPEAGMAIQKNYHNNILYPALLEPEETILNHFYGKSNLLTSSFASNFFKTELLKKWKLATKYITGDEEIRLKIATENPVLFVAGWVTWPRETPGQASVRMKPGTGIMEGYIYSTEILETFKSRFDPKLVNDIRCVLKRNMARYLWQLIKKGKISTANMHRKSLGLQWNDIITFLNYKQAYSDVLDSYTPVAPFKRGFLRNVK